MRKGKGRDTGHETPDHVRETRPGETSGPTNSAPRALELFDREPPAGYVDYWTNLLAQVPETEDKDLIPVVIFRLGTEWLALPVKVIHEFTEPVAIHRIPHRSSGVLLGIASVRGTLRLAVSLHSLLEIEPENRSAAAGKKTHARMTVLRKGDEAYVTPMDEVLCIHPLSKEQISPPPVTVAKAEFTHTKGVFSYEERSVALLDEELIFYHIGRRLE